MKAKIGVLALITVLVFSFFYVLPLRTGTGNVSIDIPAQNDEYIVSPNFDDNDSFTATIKYVIDGDTVVVVPNGLNEERKVRLIGVDTPESVNPDESKNCSEGKEASDFLKSYLANGDEVKLIYDEEHTDKYGRDLCYVYKMNDEKSLQEILLENGMARVMIVKPNNKMESVFFYCESKAKENNVGFWGTNYFK